MSQSNSEHDFLIAITFTGAIAYSHGDLSIGSPLCFKKYIYHLKLCLLGLTLFNMALYLEIWNSLVWEIILYYIDIMGHCPIVQTNINQFLSGLVQDSMQSFIARF